MTTPNIEEVTIFYVDNFTFLEDFLTDGAWTGPAMSGLDIETESVLNPHDGRIATVQIELFGMCWVVHWDNTKTLKDVEGADTFVTYLTSPDVTKIIHNASFEHKFLLHELGEHHRIAPVHDTMAGEYILAEGSGFGVDAPSFDMRTIGLGACVERRYGIEMDKDKALRMSFRRKGSVDVIPPKKKGGRPTCEHSVDDVDMCDQPAEWRVGSGKSRYFLCTDCASDEKYKRLKKRDWLDPDLYDPIRVEYNELTERQLHYAAFDAIFCARIAEDQLREGTEREAAGGKYFNLLEMDTKTAEAIARMELHGIPLNLYDMLSLQCDWEFQEQRLREDIQELVWQAEDEGPVNIASSQQMVPRLCELGYAIASYDAAELKHFRGEEMIDKILEWKQIAKFLSTYAKAFVESVHPVTGRVHANFNQFKTTTGRLSSAHPNLQNLPSRTKLGRTIRGCVEPGERNGRKRVLVIADYSNIEMRLIADVYYDPKLIEIFNAGLDMHVMTGATIAGLTYEEMDALVKAGDEKAKEYRQNAKPANFGLGYGAGVTQLRIIAWNQYDLAWDEPEATRIRNVFHETYPGIGRYHRKIGRQIENGVGPFRAVTLDGRVRRMPRHWYNDGNRQSCYAAAVNHPIQGSSADITKAAMIVVTDIIHEFDEAWLVCQVHDELMIECYADEADTLVYVLQEAMVAEGQARMTHVPCVVDAKIADRWTK